MNYRHSHDMGRITAAEDGEHIEQCCQAMLGAAVAHLQTLGLNKDLSLSAMFVIPDDNMHTLLNLMRWVCKKHKLDHEYPRMQRALLPRLFYIASHGWDAYCHILRQPGIHNGR